MHIGAPKTGTSTLQDFLFCNAQALAQRGIRYHREIPGRRSQVEYPLGALGRAGRIPASEEMRLLYGAGTLDAIRDNSAPHLAALADYPARYDEPVAVFSSEHIMMMMRTPEEVRALDDLFSSVFEEVRYIAYFRDPAAALVSEYSEGIKRGKTAGFEEFFATRLPSIQPHRRAQRWLDAVGRDRLEVRLFDKPHLHNGDVIDDFCHVLGVDPSGMDRPEPVNVSLSVVGIECLRALNLRIPELLAQGGTNPLRRHIVTMVEDLTHTAPRLRLSPAQMAALKDQCAKSVERFRTTFFPQCPSLFGFETGQSEELDPVTVREHALDALVSIIISLRVGGLPPLTASERQSAIYQGYVPGTPNAPNGAASPRLDALRHKVIHALKLGT